jgi:hypothetical protein
MPSSRASQTGRDEGDVEGDPCERSIYGHDQTRLPDGWEVKGRVEAYRAREMRCKVEEEANDLMLHGKTLRRG